MEYRCWFIIVIAACLLAACIPFNIDQRAQPSPELRLTVDYLETAVVATETILTSEAQREFQALVEEVTQVAAASQTQMATTPTATATPQWSMIDEFSDRSEGVFRMYVPVGSSSRAKQFDNSDCPLSMASYNLDMVVEQTSQGDSFSAHLDLHGIGTVRSWYAQIGYYSPSSGLMYFCQAYSYSSGAERYWKSLGPASQGQWTNFGIEVRESGEGWGYAFRYILDGEEVCFYQPPDQWDGDNSYDVLWRGAEVYVDDRNQGEQGIEVLLDKYEGFTSPVCGWPEH